MKKITTLLVGLFFVHALFAQRESGHYKVVPLVSKQTYTLNSGGRAMFGGKSRNYLLVQLPPNTIEWYYALTTTPEQAPAPTIGLADQLVKYLSPTGLVSTVMSALITPNGSGACDIFLLTNQNDLNNFMAKQGQVPSLMSGTRQNFNQGVVQVRDALQGNYFLAMRNPSGISALKITIEVSAIVRE